MSDPDLETEGQVEKIGGKIQKKIDQVEKGSGKWRVSTIARSMPLGKTRMRKNFFQESTDL
jgi:hypothetical protein